MPSHFQGACSSYITFRNNLFIVWGPSPSLKEYVCLMYCVPVYVLCVYVLCVYVLCVYVLCVYVLCVYVLCVYYVLHLDAVSICFQYQVCRHLHCHPVCLPLRQRTVENVAQSKPFQREWGWMFESTNHTNVSVLHKGLILYSTSAQSLFPLLQVYLWKQLFAYLLFLLLVPFILYLSIFYIHLHVLYKAGPHDDIMTSGFQASLEVNVTDWGSSNGSPTALCPPAISSGRNQGCHGLIVFIQCIVSDVSMRHLVETAVRRAM